MILTIILSVIAGILFLVGIASFHSIQEYPDVGTDPATTWGGSCAILSLAIGWYLLFPITLSWPMWILILVGYAVIGGAWSLFQWKNRVLDYIEERKETLNRAQYSTEQIKPLEVDPSIAAAWVVGWPLDVIRVLVIDVVKTVKTYVVEKFLKGIYNRVSQYYIDKANK